MDFILNNKNDGDNNFYLLEVNTHPGFTPTSLVPKIAKHAGISFEEIVEYLLNSAEDWFSRRYRQSDVPRDALNIQVEHFF